MIVWGGTYSIGADWYYLNDGKRYDPATDSWTDLEESGLAARTGHSAVWTGSEMILWGGRNVENGSDHYLNDGKRYSQFVQVSLPLLMRGGPAS